MGSFLGRFCCIALLVPLPSEMFVQDLSQLGRGALPKEVAAWLGNVPYKSEDVT